MPDERGSRNDNRAPRQDESTVRFWTTPRIATKVFLHPSATPARFSRAR